jgi:DNA-directed RNA polymerase sigma subunit (sigma70/sigma32)
MKKLCDENGEKTVDGLLEDLDCKAEEILLEDFDEVDVYDLAIDGLTSEDTVFLSELKKVVSEVLATLTPREERILRKRFGIGLKRGYTSEEVGAEFNVSSSHISKRGARERIRRIECRAIVKIKHSFKNNNLRKVISDIGELHDRRAA